MGSVLSQQLAVFSHSISGSNDVHGPSLKALGVISWDRRQEVLHLSLEMLVESVTLPLLLFYCELMHRVCM